MHNTIREHENVRGLDLTRRDGGLLVVGSKLGGLGGDALENVVDEGVEDAHGAVGDTGVGVDLLEDCKGASAHAAQRRETVKLTFVDVAGVGLLPGLGALLLVARGSSGLLASLLLLGGRLASRGLSAGGGGLLCFGRHFE